MLRSRDLRAKTNQLGQEEKWEMGGTPISSDWGQCCNAWLALSGGARHSQMARETLPHSSRFQPSGCRIDSTNRISSEKLVIYCQSESWRRKNLTTKHASETCHSTRQHHPKMWAQHQMGTSWSLVRITTQQMKEWNENWQSQNFRSLRHRQHTPSQEPTQFSNEYKDYITADCMNCKYQSLYIPRFSV